MAATPSERRRATRPPAIHAPVGMPAAVLGRSPAPATPPGVRCRRSRAASARGRDAELEAFADPQARSPAIGVPACSVGATVRPARSAGPVIAAQRHSDAQARRRRPSAGRPPARAARQRGRAAPRSSWAATSAAAIELLHDCPHSRTDCSRSPMRKAPGRRRAMTSEAPTPMAIQPHRRDARRCPLGIALGRGRAGRPASPPSDSRSGRSRRQAELEPFAEAQCGRRRRPIWLRPIGASASPARGRRSRAAPPSGTRTRAPPNAPRRCRWLAGRRAARRAAGGATPGSAPRRARRSVSFFIEFLPLTRSHRRPALRRRKGRIVALCGPRLI